MGEEYLRGVPAEQRPYVDLDRTFTDLAGQRFRPDVVNHWTGEVLEYKPRSWQDGGYYEDLARKQVAKYVERLNQMYRDWRLLEGLPEYWGRVEFYR